MPEQKSWSIYFLYGLCLPWDAILIALAVLCAPLLGLRFTRRAGVLWAILPARSWLARSWRYSTTLGHLVLLQESAQGTEVEAHELVHVRQFEAAVVGVWLLLSCAAVAAYLGHVGAGLCASALLGPWWSYFGASCAAALRGERGYLDNQFERHARAEIALQASRENGVKLVPRS